MLETFYHIKLMEKTKSCKIITEPHDLDAIVWW